VTFEDAGSKTLVTLRSQFESLEARDLMIHYGVLVGIGQSFDRLERLVRAVSLATFEKSFKE
jgi:uncharacterized protein YndB with AHSA1/START domain